MWPKPVHLCLWTDSEEDVPPLYLDASDVIASGVLIQQRERLKGDKKVRDLEQKQDEKKNIQTWQLKSGFSSQRRRSDGVSPKARWGRRCRGCSPAAGDGSVRRHRSKQMSCCQCLQKQQCEAAVKLLTGRHETRLPEKRLETAPRRGNVWRAVLAFCRSENSCAEASGQRIMHNKQTWL